MVYSTSTIALATFLLQAMTVMSTPLQLSPPPVESATPDSIGSFGAGWSTSPMRGPLPIQQPPYRPSFRVGTTQLGPLLPKYTYQGMDSDLHARSDIASDVADLAKFLNSRDIEMLDARGFGGILGKIFGKLGPLLLQRREVDDEAMAQLEHLLQSRELADELEARGLFGFLPKLFNMISKGRNAADTILSPATPPSPPAPTASGAPAPQRRSDDPDVQIIEQLLSRELDERGFSSTLNTLGSVAPLIGTIAPYIPSIFDKIREKFSGHDQPPQATAAPVPQRRAMKDDIEELERLLGREMTDIERRGFGTKLGEVDQFDHWLD
ncbi:hypothetical protein PC9H_008659 [Pleurotus ostreatus]|uniref:Uncharacterized protein n=3 Tax=Pleurotus TaxID=5320 RepID=A0A067NVC7_PLEO1|nr:uncharacterized protein PC9H_008659 [Pleurotus ostreatus]KAF7426291.1 hypothetical protein PC9H_008659 [Pleurotus ostreatus]KAG9221758.1 hypothetical protein CCMSSC00406_0006701 [Pleurotus cornucopiae]KAJ8693781.1 hypothetical protein PTI98_008741 [Pleurotus ostreatus]KDQ32033.1 hypothetical protein PLEOSDRAFT_1100546 [Pleurotus ostreatus PC15]